MKLQLNGVEIVKMDPRKAELVFTRNRLTYQTFDLASRMLDGPGVQRAGASAPSYQR